MMNTHNPEERNLQIRWKGEKEGKQIMQQLKQNYFLVHKVSLLEYYKYFSHHIFRYLCLLPLETLRPTLGIVLTICMSLK